jgi:hypothetical protein
VTLTPSSGSPITQTGLTGASWSFTNITPSLYTVAVTGYYSGSPIVSGTGTADLTSASSATVPITLNYIVTGSGTGQISLTFDFTKSGQTVTSATLQMVSPSGSVSYPSLTITSNQASYINNSASVGNYQFFIKASSSKNTAYRMESVVVVQNLTTSSTLSFASTDFTATYVSVSSLSLSKTSSSTVYDGQTDTLTATLNAGASNQLVTWTTSNASYATVSSGVVTIKVPGPQTVTITATSVEDSSATASCTYTIPAVSVSLSPTTMTLYTGGSSGTLTPTVTNAVSQAVTWSCVSRPACFPPPRPHTFHSSPDMHTECRHWVCRIT